MPNTDDDRVNLPLDDEAADDESEGWTRPLIDDQDDHKGIPPDLLISLNAGEDEAEKDLADLDWYDTQHGEGHTYNVSVAMDQGLVYTPPTDPPVLPDPDDPQGVQVAAGFGLSMEDSDPDVEIIPETVDDNDLDLEEDVNAMIRFNSETQHLTQVHVRVTNGVVVLFGTVPGDEDIDILVDMIEGIEGVERVLNYLDTEDEEGWLEE